MRAKTGSKSIVAVSLILLLAVFLFVFVLTTTTASAGSSVQYISAEVTTATGEFLPSGLVFDGAPVNLSFIVYTSEDRVNWVKDDDLSANTEKFELRFYNPSTGLTTTTAPSAVGAYSVSVAAKDSSLSEFFTTSADPVVKDREIGGTSFSVYYQSLFLHNDLLDAASSGGSSVSGVSELLLPDDPSFDFYGDLISGTALYLGGEEVPAAKYELTAEYRSAGVFAPVVEIKKVGTYRLKIKIDASVDLSRTAASEALLQEGGKYVYYREFSVTCEALTLALSSSSAYETQTPEAVLNASSLTKLDSLVGAAYQTQLLFDPSGDGIGRSITPFGGTGNLYRPTLCGEYVYRVIFLADVDTYGLKIGDYLDLSYRVLPVPYYVEYYTDDRLLLEKIDFVADKEYDVSPVFKDLNGNEIASVYKDDGTKKYSVSYEVYNGLTWSSVAKPNEIGKYKVIVTFHQTATVGTYEISSSPIEKEFRIVAGSLTVDTTKSRYYYSAGETPVPSFAFTSASGDESANVTAYSVEYFDTNGTSLGNVAPTAVGDYVYELRIENAIERLSVPAGAVYRGTYAIVYRPIEVILGENIIFRDAVDESVLLYKADGADPDYSIQYYACSGSIRKLLGAAPTEEGQYVMQVVVGKSLPIYSVAVGDVFSSSFSIVGTSALIEIDKASALDLSYDGGVKIPEVSFSRDASPFALDALQDYQIAYYRLVGEDYLPCDAPVLAGKYRYVVTCLTSDSSHGVFAGAYSRVQITIAPRQYVVTFKVSEGSKDLVYDAGQKTFVPSFTYKSRPITPAHSLKYALSDGDFGDDAFTNVGSYRAKVILADDQSGSISLVGGTIDFSIEKLSLKATFVVPLGYHRMWTDAAVTPEVTYLCKNGRYAGQTLDPSFGIDPAEGFTYYSSVDGVHYTTLADPIMPGNYQQNLVLGNPNVTLSEVASEGDNGEVVSDAVLLGDVASQTFKITPREVQVSFEYDYPKDGLYYTGSSEGDRKGVGSVTFMAYGTTDYTSDVSALFAGDYHIYYYTSDYSGTVSGEKSTVKPLDKSYYVARVFLDPDGSSDDYLETYTFKNGKVHGDPLGESPLTSGAYVDDVFRIKDQNKLDVVYTMPETFAANGVNKVISVKFYNNFSEIALTEGTGHDYKIEYIDEDEHANTTSYSTVGHYRLRITFLRDIIAYRLTGYTGEYSGTGLYVKEGDTLAYDFDIFERRALDVSLLPLSSFYYDGTSKAYQASFSVTEENTICAVTLTEGTHYRLRYYQKGESYALLDQAPSLPGNYAVEVVFLSDLLDYTYGGKTILASEFYSITESPSGEKLPTCRQEFSIAKAVLTVGGVKVKDKVFDGTTSVTFDESKKTLSVKTIADLPCGANVHAVKASDLTGTLAGSFHSQFPSDEPIFVDLTESGKYRLSEELSAYYELEYPAYSATISKAEIKVLLTDGESAHEGATILVTREYNPYAIESTIASHLSYDEDLIETLFPDLKKEEMTVGTLSYEKGVSGGNAVGNYPIVLNTLRLNDEATGAGYSGHPISDLFYLSLEEECYYRIVERKITVSIDEDQHKTYGDEEPTSYAVSVTEGRLIYGDSLSFRTTRVSGENAGAYLISFASLRILDKKGEDVSANYSITQVTNYFRIYKRELKISPKDQNATYLVGFSHTNNAYVLDMTRKNSNGEYGVDVTDRFLNDPPMDGDRLSGKLAYSTIAEEGYPLQYRILQGTMTGVVSATGKNVSSNYVITFDETPKYYTVTPINLVVKLKDDAVLQKYYGDKEPVIAYTMDNSETKKLGRLSLSPSSSVGRVQGEIVGEYRLYADNTARSFRVYDDGVDVTDYFTFSVRQKVDDTWRVVTGETVFKILPRPVIVTVEDASYANTGREVTPVLKFLNANGSRLSATLREDLESRVKIEVPSVEYHDGENLVTPVLSSDPDANYDLRLQAGKITVVYLQNLLTVTPLESSDPVYKGRSYMLSGIMLYKTLRFYKIETANGEQPSHSLDISLPIDQEVVGDGLVVVALRSNGKSKALSFAQSGTAVIYEDDQAYYVAIAEVQEWFYVIWGVVIIAALVALYFLVRLIIFLVKKGRKNRAAALPDAVNNKKKKKKAAERSGAFVPGAATASQSAATADVAAANETDALFSDTAVTEPVSQAAPVAPDPDISVPNADDLFTDVAPVSEPSAAPSSNAPSAPISGEESAGPAAALSELVTEQPASDGAPVSSPSVNPEGDDAPVEEAPAAPVAEENDKKKKKDKKEKEKKEKEKKGKKKEENKPKGFMPTAFKPKGDRSAAYAPTRSFSEDLFNEEQGADQGEGLFSDSNLSDGAIIAPTTPSAPSGGDDELIISRGGGFSLEDDSTAEDDTGVSGNKKKDDDLM